MDEPPQVKNKNAAAIQITAEQLLRESTDRHDEGGVKKSKQRILDEQELEMYRFQKRKEFEDAVRLNKIAYSKWVRYAEWEASQKQFDRARSVFERALNVDPRNQHIFMRYLEMEIKNKFINFARNLFDRAVTQLPRVDQFWYKYAYMEEMLGNVTGARLIYERWMQWEPNEQAWQLYLKFEKRYKEKDRARTVYARFVSLHPEAKNWLRWAQFEEDNGYLDNARNVYQQAIDAYGEDRLPAPQLFVAFAKFETRMKEHERAKAIYQYALSKTPQDKHILAAFTQFEKQFGEKDELEDAILTKRRKQYEEAIASKPYDYDTWFDYARLEESRLEAGNGTVEHCRSVYERAVAFVPPVLEKKYWRRYIYLWIRHAVFEELTAKDSERTRQVYLNCLNVIPHKQFTFAKIWLLYAKFEVRQSDLVTARKTLGRALGVSPKPKLYKGYIDLELQLREFDRCRKLYEGFLKYDPALTYAWIKYAELETLLEDHDRTRGIYELAVSQPYLDMPEILWKSYIDFEVDQQEWGRVRSLYRRLVDRSIHPKVWLSFAEFELSAGGNDCLERARSVLREGYTLLKEKDIKEERRMLLQLWIAFEKQHFSPDTYPESTEILSELQAKLPQQVKKRRKLYPEDPEDLTMEEYIDYIFPEDEEEEKRRRGVGGVGKLLAAARQWKENQAKLEEETKS